MVSKTYFTVPISYLLVISPVNFQCSVETGYICGDALIYLLGIVVLPLSYNTDGGPSIIPPSTKDNF